ncbi:HlyD family type I secretion periplasmic adaptor subunit [Leptolyngbya sp. FACHB-711]|nr:HlyD family type I secretion periplasmic adaptor subunit [Leptolyngbya sp. FACHB-711]MBD1852109.1 HlyD family type I secretion periplasmic adaptor subunit [Cyanobacteria bacterium FACHB-502]MBD2023141.1 HlyD family type I secretion periplasmic adaptor subunit [Leptolyngbya sp. FACHB-711]
MNGRNGAGKNGKSSSLAPLKVPAHQNGNGKQSRAELAETGAAEDKLIRAESFDQPILLQQTSLWSRCILWGIMGVAGFVIVWAAVAQIEEAVPAAGQLQPEQSVQPIQAPVGGVVQEILVKDGQSVNKGDLLIRFDPTAAAAQEKSLEQVKASLTRQNQFYRSQLAGSVAPSLATAQQLNLSPEVLSLTENRSALLAENQLYRAQFGGSGAGLSPEQQIRLQASQQESSTRAAAAQFEVAQLQQQLTQTEQQLASTRQSLAIDEKIYSDLAPLLVDGGIARIQVVKQEQQVIQSRSEANRLAQEAARLRFSIAQAQQKLQNTVATTNTDLLSKIAENDKRIADIDSQINKAILDNENRISEIDSQLSQAKQTLRYQELRAPIDGVVFDLQAKGSGFVANSTEPILKIVPSNALVAEVFITNQDIGFVAEGLPVDVRVDSFPFSEFGDIKGKIINIGSDALPPDQNHQFYRFPAKIQLDQQYLAVNGNKIPLQSGMSISANIITRKRSVMSIFTDSFSRKVDSVRTVR